MNQQQLQNTYSIYTFSDEGPTLEEMVQEMKALEIDIEPFLQIAANDVINHYGEDVIAYANNILSQMHQDNNANGIFLWEQLSRIIKGKKSKATITIH